MNHTQAIPVRPNAASSAYRILSAFPIAAFSLTVLTDLAYWRTANLLWLHFSEWLLFSGIVFAGLAALVRLAQAATHAPRLAWPYYVAGLAVLVLATLNNFIHTEDGITAVMPYGLTVSVLTVLAMAATAFFGRTGARHA